MKQPILLLAALLLIVQGTAQTIRLESKKCDAVSQVMLQQKKQAKGDNATVRLLAKVNDLFDASALQAEGITIGSRAGDIITLRLRADQLSLVENCAGIEQYSLAHSVYPTLNRTRFDTRTDSVQNGLGLPQAYTGSGVLIGITDWGFDYTNPNYNNNGESNRRLLRAWDQFKLSGPAPAGFDYGTEFDNRHDLLAAKCDTAGLYGYATHGTHVAGICAGRGIEGNYGGQAPGANLLFASFELNLAAWLDAVNWMKGVAQIEGKRLVINNSWGMYTLGPIDGTSLASQAINSLSDSGIVFVTSGGNCGDDYFHISHTFTPQQADTLRTVARYYGYQENGEALVVWGEPGKSFSLSFAMMSENDSLTFRWVSTTEGNLYIDSALHTSSGDRLPFDMTVEQSSPTNNRPHVLLNVKKDSRYGIHLAIAATEGTVHAWNICTLDNGAGNMGASFSNSGRPNYTSGDNSSGIGEPACAESCIAVAAHNADGRRSNGDDVFGSLANFSSRGPVMDGRHKPDVSAPGMNVVSSINYFTTDNSYMPVTSFTYANREYIWSRMSGTSMSCPAVTGIVALLLEANPSLTPQQIREILCTTARNDELTGPLHERDSVSDEWGWGKVDALAAVNKALSMVDIREADSDWFARSLQVFPNPTADRATVLTGRQTVETVQLYSVNGTLLQSHQAVMETTLDLSTLPHGIYIVKCGARVCRLVH